MQQHEDISAEYAWRLESLPNDNNHNVVHVLQTVWWLCSNAGFDMLHKLLSAAVLQMVSCQQHLVF